jgi:hypothetical protein
MNIGELPAKVVGMSNAEYRAHPADSRSFLHTVAKHGGEVQLWIDTGNQYWGGNAATSKGSEFDAIVEGILGGKSFEDMVVSPPADVLGANGARSTKAYREWAEGQTAVIVTDETRWQYEKMLASMRTCDAAYSLMQATTETQVSAFFELDGHLLKVRPDACTPTLWWDLKTTSQPWDRLFRSALDYGYAEQEWLYTQGAMALGMEFFRMPFVFVQTTPPYGCRVFILPEELVSNAGMRMISVMEQVRLRRSTGQYMPADADEVTEMPVPKWALKEEEVVEL